MCWLLPLCAFALHWFGFGSVYLALLCLLMYIYISKCMKWALLHKLYKHAKTVFDFVFASVFFSLYFIFLFCCSSDSMMKVYFHVDECASRVHFLPLSLRMGVVVCMCVCVLLLL